MCDRFLECIHQGFRRFSGSGFRVTTRMARWGKAAGSVTARASSSWRDVSRGVGMRRHVRPAGTISLIEHRVLRCSRPSSAVRLNGAEARASCRRIM